MEPVNFEEVQYARRTAFKDKKGLDLTGMVLKTGLVSTVKGAQIVLLVVAILILGFAGWFYYTHTPHLPSEREARSKHPEFKVQRGATP